MKFFVILSAAGLFLITASFNVEARPDKRLDPGTKTCRVFTFEGNWTGFETFRNTCKSCHYRNNTKDAPFLYTESKTSEGWNRVFDKKYPACAKDGSWGDLTLEKQLFLNDYLYANGFGSYDANTDCG